MTASGSNLYPALFVLHEGLTSGDRTLGETFARLVYRPLAAQLQREFRGTDEHATLQEVGTAILAYLREPERCVARSGADVFKFLCVIARRRLANYHRNERTRARLEGEYAQGTGTRLLGFVREGESREDGHEVVELSTPAGKVQQEEDAKQIAHRRQAVMSTLESDMDRQILSLRLDGVRSTKAYAEVLGIAELPIEQQRRIVKQHKDRIDKIVRRSRAKSGRSTSGSVDEETS
jgi:DNA-directed RNA polymerase specialized sigma24 family protein